MLSENAQVSSHQSLDDPSESNVLDKVGLGLLESSLHSLLLYLQIPEANLDESPLASRPEIRVIFADDLVHKAFLHVAQVFWNGSFRAFHWWLNWWRDIEEVPAVLKHTVRSIVHPQMSKRRYFSLSEPIVNRDMHCSDEVPDFPVYDLDAVVLVLFVDAESLVLDLPSTDFFISGEIANTMLAHSVDAESIGQEKFYGYPDRQKSPDNAIKKCHEHGRQLTRAPKVPVPVHSEVLGHDGTQVDVVRFEDVGLCKALA